MWIQFAIAIVCMIVSYALQPDAGKPTDATAGNLDIPEPDPSKPVPVVFGTNVIKDSNVIWYGDASTSPIRKSGGKK